jgi:hypothetical protein
VARFRVKLNHAGMRELLTSAGVQQDLDNRTERMAAAAQAAAPVQSGDYRDSIHAEPAPTRKRARAKVVADVPYALVVEAKHRTLGRALDAGR